MDFRIIKSPHAGNIGYSGAEEKFRQQAKAGACGCGRACAGEIDRDDCGS